MRGLTLPSRAGIVLAAAAFVMLLARLPGAFSSLTDAAHAAAGRNALGGALATADAIGLNDDFVRDADALVPRGARFAVVLPANETAVEKADGVSPITFDGVSALFANYLLPRRQVKTATRGTYILCFHCDAAWNARTRWLAPATGGGRVGYVDR